MENNSKHFSFLHSSIWVSFQFGINAPIFFPVHRNMPKDQALDFVQAEYNRGLLKEISQRDPADIAAQASQLLDDFLDREKIARHTVPSEIRHLLSLLADGVHMYPEELESISEYITSRQEHLQGEIVVINWVFTVSEQTVAIYSF